jgi:hypothetical protein
MANPVRLVQSVVATAVFVLLAGVTTSCSTGYRAPDGYHRLGRVDGAVVYGQREAPYVSVLVTRGGATLCNSRGAIGPVRAPAPCNEHSNREDVYAVPVAKSSESTDLVVCSANGQQFALTRLKTPPDWDADIAVRAGASDGSPYVRCG